ncbi:MBL fold metallo-hydrolase [Sediminibacillus halophilus]|uniref:Glyoxylase, beta-lactamase superfamily II n=1 Tax=Sediminibacillus halophilus TaxID=482461 RepID=A0A1G9LQJ8_9BACI|nr:MBL fold metallo-hydrolase [Sediminibacillus halophilus]SDL64208.1 Glyoxylase, beta-lactamase superfamily II [Sediminibacillus halophilus]
MAESNIYQITVPTPFAVGDAHVYLIKGDTLSLIDAGTKTKQAWEALLNGLKKFGYTPNDIEQLILTHHHPDHIGFTEEFPRLKAIYGHALNDVWLKREEAYFQRYEQFFHDLYIESGVPESYQAFLRTLRSPLRFAGKGELSEYLTEGDHLPGHEEYRVVETPGHAQSHISFYQEASGAFIGGDHLLSHISSNPLLEPPTEPGMDRPKPMLQYRSALIRCKELGIHTVYPGHGPIFTEAESLIDKRLKKQEQRADRVREILEDGSKTAFQICERLFPNQIDKEFGLTMSETIGQLDYLEDCREVQRTKVNGIYKFLLRSE